MVIITVLSVIIFIIIILFSFPQFSPIPYFPSNQKDMGLILKALRIRNNQTIIDLGAGDGIVVFEAARYARNHKLNTRFIAIDINPILVFIMHIRCLLHPNRKNIKIVGGDMFKYKFKMQNAKIKIASQNAKIKTMTQWNHITIYLYISPWFLEKVVAILKKQFDRFDIVSYYYPIPSLKYKERKEKGIHDVNIYNNI